MMRLLLFLMLLALLTGCGSENKSENLTATEELVPETIEPNIYATRLPNPQGDTISLKDLKGKLVYMEVWASWCGPCRKSHPRLSKTLNEFKSNPKFASVMVSLDADLIGWKKAILKDSLTAPIHLIDDTGGKSDFDNIWGITKIPSNFIISPSGEVLAKDLHGDELDAYLRKNLEVATN